MCFQPGNSIQGQTTLVHVDKVLNRHGTYCLSLVSYCHTSVLRDLVGKTFRENIRPLLSPRHICVCINKMPARSFSKPANISFCPPVITLIGTQAFLPASSKARPAPPNLRNNR